MFSNITDHLSVWGNSSHNKWRYKWNWSTFFIVFFPGFFSSLWSQLIWHCIKWRWVTLFYLKPEDDTKLRVLCISFYPSFTTQVVQLIREADEMRLSLVLFPNVTSLPSSRLTFDVVPDVLSSSCLIFYCLPVFTPPFRSFSSKDTRSSNHYRRKIQVQNRRLDKPKLFYIRWWCSPEVVYQRKRCEYRLVLQFFFLLCRLYFLSSSLFFSFSLCVVHRSHTRTQIGLH